MLAIIAVFGGIFAAKSTRSVSDAWELIWHYLSNRAIVLFILLGAVANVSFSLLAGYVNPRDFVQDVIAAHQFLKHQDMYPEEVSGMGVAELAAPVAGRGFLEHVPLIRAEFATLSEPPVPAVGHPPIIGLLLSAPVFFLGLRGAFLLVFLLGGMMLGTMCILILRELFPPLSGIHQLAVLGLVFSWYPVDTSLRSGQPGIILSVLISAAWIFLRRDKPALAGACIGVAASIQAFPALLLVFLAVRARRAFLTAIGTITVLSAGVMMLTSVTVFGEWLRTASRMNRQFGLHPGNLSISSLISRLAEGEGVSGHLNVLSPLMILVITMALVLYLRPWNRPKLALDRLGTEYSVFIAAMLVASPIAWGRYFPMLLLPLAVLIRNWRLKNSAAEGSAMLAALLFMSFPDSLFGAFYDWLMAHGSFIAAWLASALPSVGTVVILFLLARSMRFTGQLTEAEQAMAKTTA